MIHKSPYFGMEIHPNYPLNNANLKENSGIFGRNPFKNREATFDRSQILHIFHVRMLLTWYILSRRRYYKRSVGRNVYHPTI